MPEIAQRTQKNSENLPETPRNNRKFQIRGKSPKIHGKSRNIQWRQRSQPPNTKELQPKMSKTDKKTFCQTNLGDGHLDKRLNTQKPMNPPNRSCNLPARPPMTGYGAIPAPMTPKYTCSPCCVPHNCLGPGRRGLNLNLN